MTDHTSLPEVLAALDLPGLSEAQSANMATAGDRAGLEVPMAVTPVSNPLIRVSDAVVGESAAYVDLVISLSAPGTGTVTVSYATQGFTASSGQDYQHTSGTLTFAAGETSKTVRINLLGDVSSEVLQSFNLVLSNATGGTVFDGVGQVLIVDNDIVSSQPQIYVRDVVVDEAAGTATFLVTLGKTVGQSSPNGVSVDYTTVGDSAASGTDFTPQSGTLNFAPGQSMAQVTVALTADGLAEGAEFFRLNLSNAVGATIARGSALAEIAANGATAVSQPLISVRDAIVNENDGFIDIVVSLNAPGTGVVTVNYTTSGYTASGNGSDYQDASGTLRFAVGETTKTVRVELVDGATDEGLETFNLSLSNATGGSLYDGIGQVLIVDNDTQPALPELFVRDVVIDEKAGQAIFMVSLGKNSGQSSTSTVTVDYATVGGSAAAGTDFTARTGTLSFLPGESVKTVVVDLIDDAVAESAEFFSLDLSNASGATIARGTALAEIGANDATAVSQPLISVRDAIVSENDGFVDIVVSLNAPGTGVVAVNYTTSGYTASGNGSDYQDVSGTLRFAVGETTKTVRVELAGNTTAEGLETFDLLLSAATGGSLYDGIGQVLIVDNDTQPALPELFVRDVVIDEKSGKAIFMVSLGKTFGQSSTSTVTVDYATVGGSAVAGTDFTARTGTLSFLPGESVKTVVVDLIDDAVAESAEFFSLDLSNASGATIARGTALAEIGANDATAVSQPLISVRDAIVNENDGFVDIVVSLNAPGTSAVSVNYTTSGYTASGNGSDYQNASGTLRFAVGETTKTVRVELVNGGTAEKLETFNLELSGATGGSLYDGIGQVLIVDNDTQPALPELFVRDVVVDEKAGKAIFMVSLGKNLGQSSTSTVTVDYTTVGGSAAAGSDFTARTGTLTFTPGESVKTVVVDLIDDAVAESAEFFSLDLSNASGATIALDTARAEIGANDAAPVAQPLISVRDAIVSENDGFADIVVSLNAPGTSAVSVNYSTPGYTADSYSADFHEVYGTLRFAAGETTKTVRVELVENSVAETLETFSLVLSGAVGGSVHDATGQVLIVDNDTQPALPGLFISDIATNESSGTARFTVSLGRSIGESSISPVTVAYTTFDGSATAGSDYRGLAGTLTFAPGESAKTVEVELLDDAAVETAETFGLRLFDATGASIIDGNGLALIGASDGATPSLPLIQSSPRVIAESDGIVDLVVSLSTPSVNLVTVAYQAAAGTAGNGSDFWATSGVLRFLPGETVATVRVELIDNIAGEAVEYFNFNLLNAVGGVIAAATRTVTIVDDDNGMQVFAFGPGDDHYLVTDASDVVIEDVDGGVDTITTKIDLALPDNVEHLVLLTPAVDGTGNVLNNRLTGNDAANTLTGLGGDDTLEGGAGADTLVGGLGNDVYVVDHANDTITELPGEGRDTLRTSLGGTLLDTLEDGVLLGNANLTMTGNAQANRLTGNAGHNTLNGLAGADTLEGGGGNDTLNGGSGADTMIGGTGNDVYIFDNGGDVIVEDPDAGTDEVRVYGSHTLAANVENARILSPGVVAVVGNALDNLFIAASGDNYLYGGAGNDTVSYAEATAGITLSLASGGVQATGGSGNDLVSSVEHLIGSAFADNLFGNTSANRLDGGAGNDILNGSVGADTMVGGLGDDIFYFDNGGDQIIEAAGGGTDEVRVYGSHVMTANVENLRIIGTGSVAAFGNSLDNVLFSGTGDNTLSGGLGTDTANYSTATGAVTISLAITTAQATGGSGSETLASIENLTGSAFNDRLTGNTGANLLTGAAGNDSLDGGDGNDTLDGSTGADSMIGGAGDDVYVFDNAGDVIVEAAGGGTDEVRVYGSHVMTANVENLRIIGSGTVAAFGNALDNVFFSGSGDNTLSGGLGSDTANYSTASSAVTVSLAITTAQATGGSGTETLASIENLTGSAFNDSLTGDTGANLLAGGAGNDTLSGGNGNDTLDGSTGADSMVGGLGDDVYFFDNAGDVIVEAAGGGIDEVRVYGSHVMTANVENLRIIGSGTVAAFGNALDNVFFSGSGDNTLNGGAGTDTANYSTASSAVTVSLAITTAQATGGSGNETLASIESLTGSAFNDSLTGNVGANLLTGGAGNDTLSGGDGNDTLDGSSGADSMVGGTGDDVYFFDNGGDVIVEAAGGGTDEVRVYGSHVMAANVENLRVLAASGVAGFGNALDNAMVGAAGNDILNGGAGNDTLTGGAGSDSLTGGSGSDVFVLDSLIGSDTITDFASGIDKLRISQAGIAVGNGDTVINGATTVAGPGGFSTGAELVVVTGNIAGAITTASAAAAIGSASSAYTIGSKVLFMVDNGSNSALYLFTAANADALVSSAELTLMAQMNGTPAMSSGDLIFGP